MSDDNTIRPELTEEQAEALLTYTKTSLGGDDSFDEFREEVSGARDELEKSIRERSDKHPKRERWEGQVDSLPYESTDFEGGEKVKITYSDIDGVEQSFTGEIGEYMSHNGWLLIFGVDQSPEVRTPDFIIRRDGVVLIEPYHEGDLFPVGECVAVRTIHNNTLEQYE